MARTPYQQRRAFINKINKRIKTFVERAGVDKKDIESLIDINGVWFTETGNMNITAEAFTLYEDYIKKTIESIVPTYMEKRENIRKDIELLNKARGIDEVPSIAEIHLQIRSEFSFESNFEEYKNSFYEIEELDIMRINGLERSFTDAQREKFGELDYEHQLLKLKIQDKMRQLGKDWREGNITPAEMRKILEEIEKETPENWKKPLTGEDVPKRLAADRAKKKGWSME